MKRLIIFYASIITLLIGLNIPANAYKNGDVIGSVQNTDIVAYINNYAIPSYAANGTSLIVAEDLRSYGFDVSWVDGSRSLYIERNDSAIVNSIKFSKNGKPGSKFCNLLYSDITTYANGNAIPTYAIDGYTMIPLESLQVLGEVNWVPEQRALKLWVDGLHINSYMEQIEQFVTVDKIPYIWCNFFYEAEFEDFFGWDFKISWTPIECDKYELEIIDFNWAGRVGRRWSIDTTQNCYIDTKGTEGCSWRARVRGVKHNKNGKVYGEWTYLSNEFDNYGSVPYGEEVMPCDWNSSYPFYY